MHCIKELKICAQTLSQPLNPQEALVQIWVLHCPSPRQIHGFENKSGSKGSFFFCYFSIALNKERSIP